MSNKLINEIEVILRELGKVITDPKVLNDFESLLKDISNEDYFAVIEDVIALAGDMVRDL